jgi:adenine phosphoribosyltransferase
MKPLQDYVYTIPDFPGPGILFRDVTGILDSDEGFRLACDGLAAKLLGVDFDKIAGIESRGFLFGAPLADRFRKGFVPVRKEGKLPRATISRSYALEYGTATLEVHRDAIRPGERVVVVDDLLATGGTMSAACELVEDLGGHVVKALFVIELAGFQARGAKLAGRPVESLIVYDGK